MLVLPQSALSNGSCSSTSMKRIALSEATAEVTIKVPFFDVDMMRIVWHGHYIKYFEVARCALLDKINYNYLEMERSGYAWPIVDCRIKFVKPAIFNKEISVRAKLVEFENRIKISYQIFDIETGVKLTSGFTVQVAVDGATGEMCFVSPEQLRSKFLC